MTVERPGDDASVLLNDDGSIDAQAIQQRRSRGPSSEVPEDRCAEWREQALGTSCVIEAINTGHHASTVREHVSGRCSCEHDTAALEYDRSEGTWKSSDWLSAGDLLNDDGSIDVSAIRQKQSGSNPQTTPVSPDECRDWRKAVRGASSAMEQLDTERAKTTVHAHIRGECQCEHDQSALTWQSDNDKTGMWVVDS